MPEQVKEASPEPVIIDDGRQLSDWLAAKEHEGQVVKTRLKPSDRVIARVTDGIYRQPMSALRELISNAWDADANTVTISTDAPRFARISIRDDGVGMSYETLARLLHHIGGSAKRSDEGRQLGVTNKENSDITQKGRLLIGKIGIGLFSISQLTRRFRLVTKVAGQNYRLIAEIRMRAYSEDSSEDAEREGDDSFVSGEVLITREPALDIHAHGTDIILDDVKPRVRDLLRSADRWRAIDEKKALFDQGDTDDATAIQAEEPRYHSGWIQKFTLDEPPIFTKRAVLPWRKDDPADARMRKLIEAVEAEDVTSRARPDLAATLDTYLEGLWSLALSVPVQYVDQHPFELTAKANLRLFWITEQRGSGLELKLQSNQTVRECVRQHAPGNPELRDGAPDPAGGFRVVIDGVELRRPIQFKFIRAEERGLSHSMLFVGRYNPNLSGVDSKQRGGDLELESYLFWNGRIIPKENNGVLVRIRGASSGIFDPTFFKYQVSEQTRLRQITSEIFVQQGVDAALNIDRESFNFAHPHIQLMSLRLHKAIRQLTNRHKDEGALLLAQRRAEAAVVRRSDMDERVQQVWKNLRGSDPLPSVEITTGPEQAKEARQQGYVAFARSEIPSLKSPNEDRDSRARALTQVLSAYGLLEDLKFSQQQELIDAIMRIFENASTR